MKTNNNQKHTPLHKNHEIVVCLLIVLITFFVYSQLITYDFINFDDPLYVSSNTNVSSGISIKNILWAFDFNEVTYWHPLTLISHMVDCQIFGLNAGMHHLVNLLIHIANSLLLFFVLKQATGELWRSAFVALIFAIHPVNVESVAWIAERKNVLSTFFWMLTMYAYIFYTKRPGMFKYLLVVLFFILGLLSKPMIVTLPFVLLLFDYWPLGRIEPDNLKYSILRVVPEKIPLIILSLFSVIISSLSLKYSQIFVSQKSIPLDLRIENAIVSYAKYIIKLFWPSDLALIYPFPNAIPSMHVFISLLFMLLITIFSIIFTKKRKYFFTGWFWYIGTLLPVTGIVQGGLWPEMADRWAYIPSIGVFVIIVWGIYSLLDEQFKLKKIYLFLSGALCLSVLMLITYIQVGYWKNSYTIFDRTLKVTQNNFLAHNNMGSYLLRKGKIKEAKKHFSDAILINPYFEEALNNTGIVYFTEGNYFEAIDYYRKALKLNPDKSETLNNIGVAMIYSGNIDEAIKYFTRALETNHEYKGAYDNLKKALKLKASFVNQTKKQKAAK